MNIALIIIYVIATASGLTFIKLGSADGAPISIVEHSLKFNINPSIIIGLVLYVFSFVLYTYLLSKYNLGYIIPITTALVYIVVFILSFFVFHEAFTILKIAGISLILFGVALLNIKK